MAIDGQCYAYLCKTKLNTMSDFIKIRNDFPILKQTVYGKPLVYLDNGATTQKPQVVIDAIKDYYET